MSSVIGNTHTSTGLRVECHLDTNKYPKGTKVSKKELSDLNIARSEFRGEWNYSFSPHPTD